MLGIGGEGRVSPLMPGCLITYTVINEEGFDWSKIVQRDGAQVATVGTHWPMSRAINNEELNTLLWAGTCMGCHQNMTDAHFF